MLVNTYGQTFSKSALVETRGSPESNTDSGLEHRINSSAEQSTICEARTLVVITGKKSNVSKGEKISYYYKILCRIA